MILKYPYVLELEADYVNIGNFLSHLSNSEILSITNSFTLDRVSETNALKANINLDVYFYDN